ncbi:hypothetical protein MMC18_008938 [Xylographa bjoerkii]|nr:hypothetical protein [Xylographa bjoerkii]
MTVGMVTMITDGQIQGGFKTVMIMPLAPAMPTVISTVAAVTEFSDGQPQAPMATSALMTTSKPIVTTPNAMVTMAAVTEFSDGQPQVPKITAVPVTAVPVSVISDGQPQAPLTTAKANATIMVTSVISKAPVANTTTMITPAASMMPTVGGQQIVACATAGTLKLTLANGILKDSFGRTGYIASNFQFQFDNPPQAGAIFTAGFSVCANGSLALGGSNIFYQCLSGSFYNLYNQNWAPQCSPVTIESLMLINCAT